MAATAAYLSQDAKASFDPSIPSGRREKEDGGRCLVLPGRRRCAPAGAGGGGVGAGAPGGGGRVDDNLGHGDLAGLALARLDDLLRGLVVDGVEDQLRHREEHAQPVGDLRGHKEAETVSNSACRRREQPGLVTGD